MYESSFPLYLHSESYLDVFDRDQVVYLTPHCREELTNYDHDAVYIVGAIVDKVWKMCICKHIYFYLSHRTLGKSRTLVIGQSKKREVENGQTAIGQTFTFWGRFW